MDLESEAMRDPGSIPTGGSTLSLEVFHAVKPLMPYCQFCLFVKNPNVSMVPNFGSANVVALLLRYLFILAKVTFVLANEFPAKISRRLPKEGGIVKIVSFWH